LFKVQKKEIEKKIKKGEEDEDRLDCELEKIN